MTHEALSNTLGVRREGITEAARKLQSAGLIRYSRGRITVVDRAGLEAFCCECYGVVAERSIVYPLPRLASISLSSVIAGTLSAPHGREDCTHAAMAV